MAPLAITGLLAGQCTTCHQSQELLCLQVCQGPPSRIPSKHLLLGSSTVTRHLKLSSLKAVPNPVFPACDLLRECSRGKALGCKAREGRGGAEQAGLRSRPVLAWPTEEHNAHQGVTSAHLKLVSQASVSACGLVMGFRPSSGRLWEWLPRQALPGVGSSPAKGKNCEPSAPSPRVAGGVCWSSRGDLGRPAQPHPQPGNEEHGTEKETR